MHVLDALGRHVEASLRADLYSALIAACTPPLWAPIANGKCRLHRRRLLAAYQAVAAAAVRRFTMRLTEAMRWEHCCAPSDIRA